MKKKIFPLHSYLDTNVRPQDDFFHYANGGWMKKNPIPPNESRWGSFTQLRYTVDKQLKTIVQELGSLKRVARGSPEQIIRDFYASGMDMKRRNTLGIKPLNVLRAKIIETKSIDQLITILATLSRIGVEVPWTTTIDQDDKNAERYVLRLMQGGLGMPDRDYYLKNDPESLRVRNAYIEYVKKLYRLMGRSENEAETQTKAHILLETKLARASMKKEELRDPHKTYHKMTVSEVKKRAPHINWQQYLQRIGAGTLKTVIVNQPTFLSTVSTLISSVPLSVWKHYVEWHLVNSYSGALSSSFIRHSFSFYGKTLIGMKQMRPTWRRVLGAVNSSVGELLGKLYVQKHFPPKAKQKMEELVADLFVAYEARIKNIEWMSPGTKRKALAKLNALTRKIGYPAKWKSYRGLVISPDDYVGNLLRSAEFDHMYEMRKLKKPVDRGEWHMYPQTVNAYFAPNLNDIVFPAAILQPPFFDPNGDSALNYGAIGAVIGHEITHGFDDEGSKFDAKGNLKNWWTAQDRKRFEKRAKVLERQFNQYEVAGGIKVNGKLTLGENIADLGGVAIAYDAFLLREAAKAKHLIQGFTPLRRFFLGFASFECENVRPEFEKMQVLTDPHSPGKFRINGPASNLATFYNTFGVTKGDQLYRKKKDRAEIW